MNPSGSGVMISANVQEDLSIFRIYIYFLTYLQSTYLYYKKFFHVDLGVIKLRFEFNSDCRKMYPLEGRIKKLFYIAAWMGDFFHDFKGTRVKK